MDNNNSLGTKEERQRLFVALLQATTSHNECEDCLDSLDDYITAQVNGDKYISLYPNVAFHLDACIECADAYSRLYELEIAESANQLPTLNQSARPDLNFLETKSVEQPELEWRKRLQDAISSVGEKLRLQLSTDLLLLLHPLSAAATTRTPSDSERYQEVILELNKSHASALDLSFTMTAFRDDQQPHLCLLEIIVEPEGRSWPDLGGHLVTLQIHGEKLEEITDAWGLVSFADLRINDLAHIVVEIGQDK